MRNADKMRLRLYREMRGEINYNIVAFMRTIREREKLESRVESLPLPF